VVKLPAIAQQDLYVGLRESPVWDSESQIGLAVVVEVAGGNRVCDLCSGKSWRLKGPIAVAHQHGNRRTGRRQVGKTVAVEVRYDNSFWTVPGRKDCLRLKRAVTIAHQDADGVVLLVCD
jgi:hypothetical protein